MLNALWGSLVLSLITRSNLPVTGVTVSTLFDFLELADGACYSSFDIGEDPSWSVVILAILSTTMGGERCAYFQ